MAQPIMTGAVSHPLVQAIITYQQVMATGDFVAGRSVFRDDVIYVVPGTNLFSGTYRGPDAVMGYFGKLMGETGGSYAIDAMQWLVCGDKVLLEKIPKELRAYGDASHLDNAIALSKRLREAGKLELADNIEKWAQRAGWDRLPIKGANEVPPDAPRGHPISSETNENSGAIPWLAIGFSTALVVVAIGLQWLLPKRRS